MILLFNHYIDTVSTNNRNNQVEIRNSDLYNQLEF